MTNALVAEPGVPEELIQKMRQAAENLAERQRAEAEIKALEAERNMFKGKDASKSKLLERFRDELMDIVERVENEGDRAYFGSTNDCETLTEFAQDMDDWNWDTIIGQMTSDPYADIREQRARADAAEAEIKALREALEPFRVMADSWSESEPDETLMDFHEEDGAHINLGHCRTARAALSRDAMKGGEA